MYVSIQLDMYCRHTLSPLVCGQKRAVSSGIINFHLDVAVHWPMPKYIAKIHPGQTTPSISTEEYLTKGVLIRVQKEFSQMRKTHHGD